MARSTMRPASRRCSRRPATSSCRAEPPRRSLLFIANTGEELGLLGADYFASHPTVPARQIAAAIDLDMPLLTYDFTDIIAFGGDHSTIGRTAAEAAAGWA